METSLKNIKTIKINAFEIAKANDMNDGFKSILEHLEIYTNHVISGHHATIKTFKEDNKLTVNRDKMPIDKLPVAYEKNPQDFVVGGGLEIVDGSSRFNLRLLPIVAYNKYSGLFISNGKDEEGKDITIDLDNIGEIREEAIVKRDKDGEEIIVEEARVLPGISSASFYIYGEQNGSIGQFDDRAFRIVSIYLGDTLEQRHLDNIFPNKRDPKWLSYDNEWRASSDGSFKEYQKQQMPIAKLYGLAGELNYNILKVKAPDTPADDIWKRRIKIAEVLTSYSRKRSDDDLMFVLNPIDKEDVHFVSATHYWENPENLEILKETESEYYDEECKRNFEKCKKATWKYGEPKCPLSGEDLTFRFSADLQTQIKEVEQKRKNKKTWDDWEEEKAFEAQRYNFRWTNEHTRTYSLTSLAEFNEAFHTIHKNDGTLKYGVVNKDNIFLNEDTTDFECILKHQLRGEHIYIRRKSLKGNEWCINLQYVNELINKIAIRETDNIAIGFEKVGSALRKAYSFIDEDKEKIDDLTKLLREESKKRLEEDKLIYNEIVKHTNKIDAHGATREAKKGHIALRDEYGGFKVSVPSYIINNITMDSVITEPPSPEYAINIGYLNDRLLAFKKELTLEMLMTKLVSCQREFDNWINYTGGSGYKIVYLQGNFTWKGGDIDLEKIGTEQVIGIETIGGEKPWINVVKNRKSSDSFAIRGVDKKTKISNVKLQVTGYHQSGIVGFYGCTCKSCLVYMEGEDGYRNKAGFNMEFDERHREGTDVTGFAQCSCINSQAIITGGNGYGGHAHKTGIGDKGGRAICFLDSTIDTCYGKATGGNGGNGAGGANGGYGSRAEDGGYGGDAWVYKDCVLIGVNKNGKAIGGNGGAGGKGGSSWGATNSGHGGNGGNGGDVYVFDAENGIAGKGGQYGEAGDCNGSLTTKGQTGADGYDGKIIVI